jgi:hypothetical protein
MTTPQMRHFTRVPFDCDARLISNTHEWPTHLIDISLRGALISKPDDWSGERGDQFKLEIFLAGEDIKLFMDVHVSHVEEDRIGFGCDHIDIDSASHLHRLMELNLGDEGQLEREIHEMIQRTN